MDNNWRPEQDLSGYLVSGRLVSGSWNYTEIKLEITLPPEANVTLL